MDWILWVVLPSLLCEIQAVSLNPFAGFVDQQHEPVADYSIHRGVYLSNMPTTSIFPLMADENINGMVGIPSLQSPYLNPLLQQQSLFTLAKQNAQTKPKNNRPPHSGGNIREQGNSQQKPRGVTLDIRGGGYRLEQQRSNRPYNPPNSGGNSGRNSAQRPSSGRNAASSVNRKQIQRPRNPPVRGNIKLSPNAEFINPENVLPMHPRIYKQFLQQNPQAAAYLRSQIPSSGSYPGRATSNPLDAAKQLSSKFTRNRNIPSRTHLSALSSLPNVPNKFQLPSSQLSGMQLGLGLQGQSPLNQGRQPTFEDFYNSDPQFYQQLSQTPEGKAMLTQMYQHFGTSANRPNSPNKVPSSLTQNVNPFAQTYADINNYATSGGFSANNLPGSAAGNQFANNFALSGQTGEQFNKQTLQDYNMASQFGQKPQQLLHQQQPQHQHQQQQHQHQPVVQQQQFQQHQQRQPQGYSSIPSSPQQSDYSGRQPYGETIPSPGPNTDTKTSYVSPQNIPNQYNANQYTGSGYSDDSSSSFANGGAGYDPSSYQSPYQENPKVVDGSTIDQSTIDHTAYSSNFSPSDPLATIENTKVNAPNYYNYPSSDPSPYSASSSRFPSTALHEISPSDIVQRQPESSNAFKQQQPSKAANVPGYWTPEQLFAPQSTGLQNESPFVYPAASSSSSDQQPQDEQQDGSERAALHLPEDAPAWPMKKPQEPSVIEYSAASELEADEGKDSPASTEQPEISPPEEESDERYKATMRDLQKQIWTRVPQKTSSGPTRATTVIYRSTEPPPLKATRDELRNHKTTPSYTFQYSPSEKANSKSTAAWWSRKPEGSRYKMPAPQPNTTTSTTTSSPTTTTTSTTTTTTTERPEPIYDIVTTTPAATSFATTTISSVSSNYMDDTPICAKHNNLTYCLQDPEYPKDAIREAIERNRHPLDHFLVDISAASNVVDDQSLHSVFENSAPLQSTSVSYSFEGKVISPSAGEMLNSTGCNSNVHYAKPLRALNTAGLWKVIVNVEFEDTGANYTQTVRIEECTHPPGYVATCGAHSISACLQQYKLYRLLSWESHRGFYIDAFLLPVACFCGSQES